MLANITELKGPITALSAEYVGESGSSWRGEWWRRPTASVPGPLTPGTCPGAGNSSVLLNGERIVVRNAESNLGNWLCDAMRDYIIKQTSIVTNRPGSPLLCLTNGGGIRASIPAGAVTQGQIITVSPFGNWWVTDVLLELRV